MPVPAGLQESQNYFSRLGWFAWRSLAQLVRAPSHSRRAEAARQTARHGLLLSALIGAVIIALMYVADVPEIGLMPPRGTPSLWPLRILTDFGKDAYVLCTLAALIFAVALIAPAMRGLQRSLLLGLGTRLQFLFFAVLFPVLISELMKYAVGRGRPFVGGHANAFNFSHFAGTEAYASFPSGHATTAFAAFPDKPLKLVVPFAPGGANDLLVRPLRAAQHHARQHIRPERQQGQLPQQTGIHLRARMRFAVHRPGGDGPVLRHV